MPVKFESLLEALRLLKEWAPVEAPPSLSCTENGQRFIMCSDQPAFMQSGCATAESYSRSEQLALLLDVKEYLKKQSTFLVHFQGATGNADETWFAVLKPTEWLEWGPAWVCPAKQAPALYRAGISSKSPVFILDMRCKANADILDEVLGDENILKAGIQSIMDEICFLCCVP